MVMDPMKDEPGIETHLAVVQSVQSGQKNKRKQSKKAEKEHFHSKRKIKSYVNDFTDYLPPLLIAVNKVPTLPSIRLGSRYQAVVPSQPNFRFVNRSLHELKIWNGSSDSSSHPLQEHINKFK